MSKLSIFLVASLVLMGVLLVFVFVLPLTGSEQKYSEISNESVLKTTDGWVLQFDILNYESKDTTYTINVDVDGKPFQEICLIKPGGMFSYINQIRSSEVTDGVVSVIITKEGENTPFEQGTYYLS
jgi:hypothetical protein